jgi:LRP1 type putative zinc finger protein
MLNCGYRICTSSNGLGCLFHVKQTWLDFKVKDRTL